MPKISIDLSQTDLDYLEAELADGGGKSIDDLLARAIKDYQRARGLEELDRLAQEGIDSGEPIEITPDYWVHKRQEFLAVTGHSHKDVGEARARRGRITT